MTSTEPGPVSVHAAERPLRADAQRNRERLITAARAAFAAADDTVAIESIARDAGVGIGTLYRHFATREALVEAVYAAELDDLAASAAMLLAEFPPDLALRAWVERYAEFAATKRGMIDTLRAGWASGRIATPTTRKRINTAIGTLLAAGAEAGSLRGDVDPDDVTTLLLGVFLSTSATSSMASRSSTATSSSTANSSAAAQTGRLLDLLVDALRPRPFSG